MLDKLLNIPHLDLGLQYDPKIMLGEVDNIDYANYITSYSSSKELYEKNWSGASLVSIDGSVFNDMQELKVYPDQTPKPTVLAEKCSYLMNILTDLGCNNERSRIMRIAPKGHLDWHSHVLHHRQSKDRLVVQIPIYVPQGFTYSVIHAQDLAKLRKGENVKQYDKEYKAGRAYVFNSYHPHNVFNPSSEFRITLMTYINLSNEKSKHIVMNALENYDGPIL